MMSSEAKLTISVSSIQVFQVFIGFSLGNVNVGSELSRSLPIVTIVTKLFANIFTDGTNKFKSASALFQEESLLMTRTLRMDNNSTTDGSNLQTHFPLVCSKAS